jgi:hypothetical protein
MKFMYHRFSGPVVLMSTSLHPVSLSYDTKSDCRSITEESVRRMACPVWDGHLRAGRRAGMVWVPGISKKPNYFCKY